MFPENDARMHLTTRPASDLDDDLFDADFDAELDAELRAATTGLLPPNFWDLDEVRRRDAIGFAMGLAPGDPRIDTAFMELPECSPS